MSDLILWLLNPLNAVVWAFGCLAALVVVSIAADLITTIAELNKERSDEKGHNDE